MTEHRYCFHKYSGEREERGRARGGVGGVGCGGRARRERGGGGADRAARAAEERRGRGGRSGGARAEAVLVYYVVCGGERVWLQIIFAEKSVTFT